MKDDRVYLGHIRDAIHDIEQYTAGGRDAFMGDRMQQDAVIRKFEIIGEAMTRLIKIDDTVAQQISEYRKIAGFRNALVHGYDSIDDVISWGIIEGKLPLLRVELEALLKT